MSHRLQIIEWMKDIAIEQGFDRMRVRGYFWPAVHKLVEVNKHQALAGLK